MIKTGTTNPAEALLRAASGQSSGSGNKAEIQLILSKMGTFARAVATEEYGIDQGFSFDSGLIFPLLGINHLVTRGIFQPLERAITGIPDSDKAGAAFSTASVAMENPPKFFENAEDHFSPATLEAVKTCVNISANITTAEKDGSQVKISAEELKIAEIALRGIESAISKIASDNPDVSGVQALSGDMQKIQKHYSAMAQRLLPTLSTAPKADKKS